MSIKVGVIGARGHTGKELLTLLAQHTEFDVVCASSRELAGKNVGEYVGQPMDLTFENLSATSLPMLDACILALPNGKSPSFVKALEQQQPDCVVCDLSADHRFDRQWYYGLPEHNRQFGRDARKIANPGCYATAMQLAIKPVQDLMQGQATCFGISGYSGAGTTPSDKNNVDLLQDNLLPYSPTGHIHQKEVSRQLCREVHFLPHVAPFFRGISMTITLDLQHAMDKDKLSETYQQAYEDEALVHYQQDIPQVAANRGAHHASVGGLHLSQDQRQMVIYATLDNLLKGAATQAIQNMNNAFGLNEIQGIPL